jgi:hypothetical protein
MSGEETLIEETKNSISIFKKGYLPVLLTAIKREYSVVITMVEGFLEHDWEKTTIILSQEECKKLAEKLLEFSR